MFLSSGRLASAEVQAEISHSHCFYTCCPLDLMMASIPGAGPLPLAGLANLLDGLMVCSGVQWKLLCSLLYFVVLASFLRELCDVLHTIRAPCLAQ